MTTAAPSPPAPDLLRPRGLLLAGLCTSLLLPVLFAVMLWYDLRHDNDQAAARGLIVEQSVEQRLDDRLKRLADSLQAIADDANSAAPGPRAISTLPEGVLRDVVVVRNGAGGMDPEGRPRSSGWLPPPDPDTLPSGLSIGAPIRDLPSARWRVPIAWYGTPGLRVGAQVDADWFAAILQGYPLGEGSVLNIVHASGVMLARSKANQEHAGASLRDTTLFGVHRAEPGGQFVETSAFDDVRRLFVFQRIAHSPLIVVVGIARDDILAAWWTYAAISFSVALLFAGMWLWLNRALARSHASQERLLGELRLQSRRGEEARRIANLGDWTWNLETGELFWSPENFAICGIAPREGPLRIEEVPGFVHPDDRERMRGYLARAFTDGPLDEAQFRVVRPDGEHRYVYVRAEWADRTPGHRVLRGIQQDITELAAVRERLREAQDQYRFLFEHNPMPMWVFDRDSMGFLAVNDAMIANYGYTREELLAATILDIRPDEEIEAVKAVARIGAAQRPQGRIWTHVRRNGSRLRVEIHTRDIDFEGRSARLVLGMDVTERERNQQRFQLIARATNDAIWDWDVEAGTTWRSDSYFAMFGPERDAVAPNLAGWADRIHPEDRLRATTSVQRGIDSNATEWEERFRFRREDGQYADVLYRGALFRDAAGKVVRAVGGMLDITQRNRDEVDLRLLRRAVESTDNGIVIADAREPGLPAVYVNRAFERMSGYSIAELLGSSFRFLADGGASEQPEIAALRRAVAEQREIRVLLRDYRRDGQMFWNDFYLAPVRDETGTLTHFVSIQCDVTDRQRTQEQLAFRATHDELTGLPNRQLLVDRLQQALLNAERHGRSIAVLFIDLDDFKLINDSLGHSAGDETLRLVARRLEEAVADTDTVARFGGDEFAILLTEHTDDRSVALAITCVNAALARPFDISGSSHYINASIGWCRSPDAGTLAETLLMHADLAMYKAKQGGRNRVVAYQPSFDGQVSARLRLVSELRLAIEREEFVLEFQPIFGIGGTPVALEALVRWNHPERGLLPPGHFIGVAEESGLIVALGRWVLNEAARHHALLAAQGFGLLRIAVNISSLHFQQDLYADVESAMRLHGLPPGILEIELTESVIMDNPDAAIDVMRRLDELGVAISVDDFGTGYSSLSYLKRLPIDRLKIDRSFVRDLGQNNDDAAICTSIIRLAHSLGLRTVAEGVETHEQLDWLRERGCDEVQGFLLARPEAFAAMVEALRRPAMV